MTMIDPVASHYSENLGLANSIAQSLCEAGKDQSRHALLVTQEERRVGSVAEGGYQQRGFH